MKKFAFVVLFCMLAVPAFAGMSQISIGRVSVNIPIPEGFVDVTQTAPALMSHFGSSAAVTGNRFLALILSTEDAQSEHPELSRYLSIQVMSAMENQRITVRDFTEGRRQMRTMVNAEMLEGVEEDLSQLFSQHNIQVGEMRFVPFDSESENHIAFSIVMNMSVEGEDKIKAGSYAMILVNRRMFYVYVYSAYDTIEDLTWTQNTLNNWVEAIIRAN